MLQLYCKIIFFRYFLTNSVNSWIILSKLDDKSNGGHVGIIINGN